MKILDVVQEYQENRVSADSLAEKIILADTDSNSQEIDLLVSAIAYREAKKAMLSRLERLLPENEE